MDEERQALIKNQNEIQTDIDEYVGRLFKADGSVFVNNVDFHTMLDPDLDTGMIGEPAEIDPSVFSICLGEDEVISDICPDVWNRLMKFNRRFDCSSLGLYGEMMPDGEPLVRLLADFQLADDLIDIELPLNDNERNQLRPILDSYYKEYLASCDLEDDEPEI